jgi:hypothetical protein
MAQVIVDSEIYNGFFGHLACRKAQLWIMCPKVKFKADESNSKSNQGKKKEERALKNQIIA